MSKENCTQCRTKRAARCYDLPPIVIVQLALLGLLAVGPANAQGLIKGLDASGPDPALAGKLALFGQFIGDWTFDVAQLRPDGSKLVGTGEWHFGWVLEGRAVQDVWIAKFSNARPGERSRGYGTTLRFYDAKIGAWRVTWISPLSDAVIPFTAKKIGSEIVMESKNEAGGITRWIFYGITPSAFRWRAMGSRDGGKTWATMQEFSVRRAGSPEKKP